MAGNASVHGKNSDGDWAPIGATTDQKGDPAVNSTGEIRNQSAGWRLKTGSTLAASGTATTSDVSVFLPFDSLTFTEDGGAAAATWTLQLRPGSKGVITVTGTGTIKVTGLANGVAATLVVNDAGTQKAATTLAAGAYFIEA